MKPVRVLYCNGGKLDYGGVTAVMLNYAQHFDPRYVQVDFLVHGPDKGPREDEALSIGKVFHVPYKIPHYLKNRCAIREVIQNGNYDIVHAHMDGMNGYVLSIAKRSGARVRISHCHNTQFLTTNPLRVRLHRMSANRIPKVATQLFACTEDAGRFLYGDALYDAGRVRIVHNAIDLPRFAYCEDARKAVRAELGIAEEAFVIGHIGRLDYQKNQAFLLPLLHNVLAQNDNAVLLLVGSGDMEAQLLPLATELGVEQNVCFAGVRQDIPAVLSAFDAFVLPSRFEGLGIVLVEAQANGLSCVASAEVPQATRVTDCRYMPLSDEGAWAGAVLAIQQSHSRNRTVDLSAFQSAGYDIVTEAETLQNLYRELAPWVN